MHGYGENGEGNSSKRRSLAVAETKGLPVHDQSSPIEHTKKVREQSSRVPQDPFWPLAPVVESVKEILLGDEQTERVPDDLVRLIGTGDIPTRRSPTVSLTPLWFQMSSRGERLAQQVARDRATLMVEREIWKLRMGLEDMD